MGGLVALGVKLRSRMARSIDGQVMNRSVHGE